MQESGRKGKSERKGKAVAKKKRELTDAAALEIAVRDHPEWRRAWERGELADEILGEDGQPMNPRVHLEIHAVVERQLAADDPKGVVAIARELARLGVSRHDVRHEIGAVAAKQIWRMMNSGSTFNERRYLAELRKIVESYR